MSVATLGALPDSVSAIVVCDGRPLAGMFVHVRILTSCKNDFNSVFGPTDTSGSVCFTRDALLEDSRRAANLALMDYCHPEKSYAGRMEVQPMGRTGLQAALHGYEAWRESAVFPPSYAERLQEAISILEPLAPARLSVELNASGGSGEVAAMSAEA